MLCSTCGSEYDVTPLENGKSRFCRSCGSLLYKNEDGNIISESIPPIPPIPYLHNTSDDPIEKERLELERLEREQLALEEQKRILREKQEKLLKEKQERERIERERLEAIRKQQEQERQEAERIEKERLQQRQREQEEKERLLREKIEREIREKIQREQAEKERLERELKEKLERERIERELREAEEKRKATLEKEAEEKRQAEQSELEKAATAASLQTEQASGGSFRKIILFVLLPLLIVGILGGATYFLLPKQIKAALGISTSEAKTTEVANAPENTATDNSALIEQLKTALTGKEVLSWGAIKADEIKELTIQSQQTGNGNPSYIVKLNLDDNAGTKAVAELDISYYNNHIDKATTNRISYKNTAPANAWFSFAPLKNCTILVNTNGNPVKLKGCQNCASVSMNTSAEHPEELINHPETIFIQSENGTETVVDFTYIPVK